MKQLMHITRNIFTLIAFAFGFTALFSTNGWLILAGVLTLVGLLLMEYRGATA